MLFEFRYGPEDHFSRLDSSRIIPTIESPEWRNWQTRWTQNPVLARECGFDSLLRHPQYNQRFPGSIVDFLNTVRSRRSPKRTAIRENQLLPVSVASLAYYPAFIYKRSFRVPDFLITVGAFLRHGYFSLFLKKAPTSIVIGGWVNKPTQTLWPARARSTVSQ